MLDIFGDEKVSSAVADVIFRDGIGAAGYILQDSLSKADPETRHGSDGILGSGTFTAMQNVIKNPDKRRVFLDYTALRRRQEEKDRNDYFRFEDE